MNKFLSVVVPMLLIVAAAAVCAAPSEQAAYKIASDYCTALARGDADAAHAMLSSASKEKWSRDAFAEALDLGEPGDWGDMGEAFMFMILLKPEPAAFRLADLLIQDEKAVAELQIELAVPRSVYLVEEIGQWKVDFDATDRAWALQDLEEQLTAVRGVFGSLFGMMATAGGQGPGAWSALAMQQVREWAPAEFSRPDPQHAVAKLAGKATLRAAVPVSRGAGGGWSLFEGGYEPIILRPEETLADALKRFEAEGAEEPWPVEIEDCAERLGILAEAMRQWLADQDQDVFPEVATLDQLIDEYIGDYANTAARCPAVEEGAGSGFAFNRALMGKRYSEIANPAEVVLFFEVAANEKNTVAGQAQLLRTPRHDEGIAIAYLDGHSEYVAVGAQLVFAPQMGQTPLPLQPTGPEAELERLKDELRRIRGEIDALLGAGEG